MTPPPEPPRSTPRKRHRRDSRTTSGVSRYVGLWLSELDETERADAERCLADGRLVKSSAGVLQRKPYDPPRVVSTKLAVVEDITAEHYQRAASDWATEGPDAVFGSRGPGVHDD